MREVIVYLFVNAAMWAYVVEVGVKPGICFGAFGAMCYVYGVLDARRGSA